MNLEASCAVIVPLVYNKDDLAYVLDSYMKNDSLFQTYISNRFDMIRITENVYSIVSESSFSFVLKPEFTTCKALFQ
jgi:hypothetical protein